MNGWIDNGDGQKDRLIDRKMDGQTGQIEEYISRQMDRYIHT